MKKQESFSNSLSDEPQIPLAFLRNKKSAYSNGVILAADIGATKTNLALFEIHKGLLTLIKEKSYHTKNYNAFTEMVRSFHSDKLPIINGICLGVAGPVTRGKVKGTNFPWEIDSEEISRELQVHSVTLINDMEANAFGLVALRNKDFEILKEGSNIPGNAVIISPGTGLGEAGLYWDGTHYHPYATEGGHCDFSPRNDLDWELWKYLHQKFGHVSWERVVSGPGICSIYKFLRGFRGNAEPKWLEDKIQQEDAAAVITAVAHEKSDPVCIETLDLFVRYLAIEAAQFALKTKATGGVYLGGGIVPKIIGIINREIFTENFVAAGRMKPLLQLMPVQVVLNDKTPLLGAAYYGATHLG
ncbi:glucokinase [uncultured Eudoraea sp.]|uniref:glucokinase n=1 Tax=uncultured Eudoraea sp. TaxID=1035614 RepID=UPI002606CE90|nr:glucokinase [uncultured Eudoraea sp.]